MAKRGRPRGQRTPIELSAREREVLLGYTRRRKTAQAIALRARIVLACAEGHSNEEVARRLRANRLTVGRWRRRFLERRLEGLHDEPRPGAPRRISDAVVERVVMLTLETPPSDATHWSTREMGRRLGLSHATVHRIWQAFRLQPHRSTTFRISNDPLFVEKVRDIVGLYLNPPEHALVLCVDEKSQIQALDRSQPLLPMRPGQPERRTHDYRRHGTTTLYAAFDIASGKVIGQCHPRQRAIEFVRFLQRIDRAVPAALDVHLVMDNNATHKTPRVRRWLARHPRFHVHFTPTYSSWLNQVERWFALLAQKQLRRGVHRSTRELVRDILAFIDQQETEGRPFVWTKTADQILASLERFCGYTLRAHGVEDRSKTSETGH
ncbi:MAG: IS630 family transposase [Burkholderiales bacterium]